MLFLCLLKFSIVKWRSWSSLSWTHIRCLIVHFDAQMEGGFAKFEIFYLKGGRGVGAGNFWIFYDCSPNSTTTSGERAYNLSVLKHVFHVVQQPKLNRKWSHLHFTLSPLHAPPSIQYFESGLNTNGNSGKHRIDKHIFLSWKPVAARVFFRCLSQRFVCVLLNIYHFYFRLFFYLLIARYQTNVWTYHLGTSYLWVLWKVYL